MKLPVFAAALILASAAHAQTAPISADPKGGYQPSTPLFSAPPQPGQVVIFVPNPQTPTEAYPPPPPLAHYPFCKRGQFDHCMQRGG